MRSDVTARADRMRFMEASPYLSREALVAPAGTALLVPLDMSARHGSRTALPGAFFHFLMRALWCRSDSVFLPPEVTHARRVHPQTRNARRHRDRRPSRPGARR